MEPKQLNLNRTLNSQLFLKYEKAKNNERRLNAVLKLINKQNIKICDVGGASGIFLNELLKKSKYKIHVFNLEIDQDYQNKQKNKKINFINKSILDNKIKGNFFDIATFNQVLHHLVSNNHQNTLILQKKALEEVFRITKKGGYIVFEEEVYSSPAISRITYSVSKFANLLHSKLNINFHVINVLIFIFLWFIQMILIRYHYQTRHMDLA